MEVQKYKVSIEWRHFATKLKLETDIEFLNDLNPYWEEIFGDVVKVEWKAFSAREQNLTAKRIRRWHSCLNAGGLLFIHDCACFVLFT